LVTVIIVYFILFYFKINTVNDIHDVPSKNCKHLPMKGNNGRKKSKAVPVTGHEGP
jgi:hypothetical protein